MDQQTVAINNEQMRFLRIRNTKIIEGKTAKFRQVLIVPSLDKDLSLVVLVPAVQRGKKAHVTLETMHEDVRKALAGLEASKTHERKKLWLPQFKIGDKKEQE